MELRKKNPPLPSPNPVSLKTSIVADMRIDSELDQLYLTIIQIVHLLGSAFVTPHFGQGGKTFDDTFDQLAKILLSFKMPLDGINGILISESSGSDRLTKSENVLYSIQMGDKILTSEIVADAAKRSGSPVNQVLRKLQIAFDIFSLNGIHSFYLRIPGRESNDLEHVRVCLEILSKYDQALQTESEIAFNIDKQPYNISVIKGKNDLPDPNLTLVAALNQLSEAEMNIIKVKVRDYIDQHLLETGPEHNYDMFNVLFLVKGLKEKLIQPPIQVNNQRYLLNKSKENSIDNNPVENQLNLKNAEKSNSKGSGRNVLLGDDQIVELTMPIKPQLDESAIEFLKKNVSSEENRGDEAKEKTNDNSSAYISEDSFTNHLTELNKILISLKKHSCGEEILVGIIQNLRQLIKDFQKEIDKKLSNSDSFTDEDGTTNDLIEKFHSHLIGTLSPFNNNSNKVNISDQKQGKRNELDIKKISKRFNLSIAETKEIIYLLQGCFDSKDCFLRSEFEIRIPKFISHEKKIFEFLWGYLNEPLQKNDRVAFLNSLHLLISRMENPQKVLAFLLDELYQNPLKIAFSDRNAFMLASLLLRNYNKEYSVDIELTPGEVLLVKNGLNEEILRFALSRIDKDRDLVQKKMNTIHSRLVASFDTREAKSIAWNPHFLLSLEREAFIFLSLVAGDTARRILISVLSEYGNPKSKIYAQSLDEKYLSLLLQHLKLLIRGLGRVGDIEDLGMLADLKKSEPQFVDMSQSPQHGRIVSQVFQMIDIAMGNITSLQ